MAKLLSVFRWKKAFLLVKGTPISSLAKKNGKSIFSQQVYEKYLLSFLTNEIHGTVSVVEHTQTDFLIMDVKTGHKMIKFS